MQLPVQKLAKDDPKFLAQKKKQESDITYKLVVKVISWKNGSNRKANKISSKEWLAYKKHLLNICKTESHEQVVSKIKDIQIVIQKHGGFE